MTTIEPGWADGRKRGRNQQLVLDALAHFSKPVGAYELLRQLWNEGLRSPLQVYRALNRLVEQGSVHKIESLNAFALCTHDGCCAEEPAAFTICTNCGQASELHDSALGQVLRNLARRERFQTTSTTVELSGLCRACAHG